ncbi:MAG: Gfo/Idh/MocA family oxidoreductase [Ruminococcaceae bacterium]|nr:Gfo/Idh/MocA family oxidoreductase [Oscillospiraceae bacterium]
MKKVKLAIIGAGSIAYNHGHGIERIEEAELVAVCDIQKKQLDSFRKTFQLNEAHCYTNVDEMLRIEEIDGVIICTPDQCHHADAVKAMKAGKHILCEKPMSLSLTECKEMVKIGEETGVKFMIGQVCRKAPGFVKAKEMVDRGVIGELFMVESEYAHDYLIHPGVDNWRMTPERHPIIGGGCHAVDLLRWIAGNPKEVFAYANHKMLPDWPVNDCVLSILKFPNDVIGKVMTSIGCKRNYTMRTVLYGSKGTIITDNTSNTLSLFKEELTEEIEQLESAQTVELKIPVGVDSHNMAEEIRDFVTCIVNDASPDPDGIQGLITVTVCNAIVRSVESGEKITIDYQDSFMS